MKRFLMTSLLMLTFVGAYGLAQTTSTTGQTTTTSPSTTTTTPTTTTTQPATTTTQPQSTTTPSSTGAPAPAGTAPMTPAAPQVQPAQPGTTSQQPAQQSGPGVPASAVSQNPGTSPGVPASSLGSNTNPADLQNKIMTALQGNSTLAGTGLSVIVAPDQIQVSGSVQNSQQKEAAMRIVQSFAQNRRVVDNITVLNPTTQPPASTPPPSASSSSTTGTQPAAPGTQPGATAQQQNANRPSTAQQTQGDESTVPKA